MFIDTHAHLADTAFDTDRDDVLRRAKDAGVHLIVEIGEEESQWPKARELAERHAGQIYWAVGFHPYYAAQGDPGLAERMRKELSHSACVAVGEIGLDYHRPDPAPADQKRVFESLVSMALAAGKPVVIHCRDRAGSQEAERDLIEILKRVTPLAAMPSPLGVAHCFQGAPETARLLVDQGFLIGVDAPITYPKAESLRAMVRSVPLDSLVLETDCPYLPPQSHRGKRNEPVHIPAIAESLANLKGLPLNELAATTTANARRLFRLPP